MSALDSLKGDLDPLTRRIAFAAILTAELESKGFSPVMAGDYAIELYTNGENQAGSIDVIAPAGIIEETLPKLDFNKAGGVWTNEEMNIKVRLLGEDLQEHQLQRVNQVDVNGYPVYLLGLEDVIIDKLRSYIKGGEQNAIISVRDLIELHLNEIDWDYLREQASEEGVIEPLQEWIVELKLEEKK